MYCKECFTSHMLQLRTQDAREVTTGRRVEVRNHQVLTTLRMATTNLQLIKKPTFLTHLFIVWDVKKPRNVSDSVIGWIRGEAITMLNHLRNCQSPSETNLGRIQACAEEYYDTSPTFESIWKATKHKDLTKKTREFLWKTTHNAFKIGKFWENIPNHERKGICTHCDTTESMEHILTECTAPGRELVWSLANSLLAKQTQIRTPTNFGALLGCCLTNFKKENGKPDTGLNRLFRIIISESMYIIWKIRCERTITWNNDPDKTHAPHEIHNKWLQAINSRLKIDSLHTNTKIFQKKAIKTTLVLKTWKKCLKDELHETRNWCGKTGVLVGIAPKRPPGQNR